MRRRCCHGPFQTFRTPVRRKRVETGLLQSLSARTSRIGAEGPGGAVRGGTPGIQQAAGVGTGLHPSQCGRTCPACRKADGAAAPAPGRRRGGHRVGTGPLRRSGPLSALSPSPARNGPDHRRLVAVAKRAVAHTVLGPFSPRVQRTVGDSGKDVSHYLQTGQCVRRLFSDPPCILSYLPQDLRCVDAGG